MPWRTFPPVALALLALPPLALGPAGCSRRDPQKDEARDQAKDQARDQARDQAPAGMASTAPAFGAPCVTDADCGRGVCFHKRIKGPGAGHERRDSSDAVEHDGYCSLRCNDDDDCPVPPTNGKCGARGMCKRPE